jgi:hypothetical protein
MTPTDDALLDALTVALAPAPIAPSADDLAALRALVARRDDVEVVAFVPVRRPSRPVRRVLTVAAAVVALVVSVGVVALATGSRLPRDLRAPARALGLPVDSAALADARSAIADLRAALGQPDDARVARARDVLIERLDRLGRDDRATVDAEATTLLERAAARLNGVEIGDATGTARSTTTVPTTVPPAVDTSAPGTEADFDAPPGASAQSEAVDPSATVTTEPADDAFDVPGE